MTTKQRARLTLALLAFAFSAAGLLAHAQPRPAASAPRTYKPVQSVHHMMEGQEQLFKGIKEGILDKSWEDAATGAWILAEVANSNSFQNENPEYQGFATSMSGDCAKLAKALSARKEPDAKELVTQIGRTCEACHAKFKD